jgi:L-alanine-DL-glutamate epimerase-like enolase superfamily enzyme
VEKLESDGPKAREIVETSIHVRINSDSLVGDLSPPGRTLDGRARFTMDATHNQNEDAMKFRILRVDLPLKHVFTISRSSVSVVRTIVVELEQDGLRGYGEAQEDTYYDASVEGMVEVLEKVREKIESYVLADPVAFWRHLSPELQGNRFAQCALDVAACDLWGKMRERPLWRLWGMSLDQLPVSSFTIGIDSVERMVEKLKQNPDWPVYKIKLGTREDVEILRALRQETDAPFRVDVNGGWDVENTLAMLPHLEEANVEFLEQPLPIDDWEGMAKLKKKASIPIFADESCQTADDLDRCAEVFDGVNIKLVKCGGLTPARQMIGKAKHLGLQTMMGCMVESTIGISAIAQLAPQLDYVDMDGPYLIDKKVGTGVELERGRIVYPEEGGTGVQAFFR